MKIHIYRMLVCFVVLLSASLSSGCSEDRGVPSRSESRLAGYCLYFYLEGPIVADDFLGEDACPSKCISPAAFARIRRLVVQLKPDTVVVSITSDGGSVDACLKMLNIVSEVSVATKSICRVPRRAISSAAVLCLAFDEIQIAEDAVFGAALSYVSDDSWNAVDAKRNAIFLSECEAALGDIDANKLAILHSIIDPARELFKVTHRDSVALTTQRTSATAGSVNQLDWPTQVFACTGKTLVDCQVALPLSPDSDDRSYVPDPSRLWGVRFVHPWIDGVGKYEGVWASRSKEMAGVHEMCSAYVLSSPASQVTPCISGIGQGEVGNVYGPTASDHSVDLRQDSPLMQLIAEAIDIIDADPAIWLDCSGLSSCGDGGIVVKQSLSVRMMSLDLWVLKCEKAIAVATEFQATLRGCVDRAIRSSDTVDRDLVVAQWKFELEVVDHIRQVLVDTRSGSVVECISLEHVR